MNIDKYNDIRPYNDLETESAVKRMVQNPLVGELSDYFFDGDKERLAKILSCVKSVKSFQEDVMSKIILAIIEGTTTGLTYSGLENIGQESRNMIISNHRDIILDSAFIQIILFLNKLPTTQIAVGDNLIANSFIEDITRSNRMIKVIRNTTPREIYNSSKTLSEYIRGCITSGYSSIWLAQRNGRTKDGIDITEQGVLKMLDMSGSGDFAEDFDRLNLLPISISYQYEPCDFLKVREMYISKRHKYIKQSGEDTASIITGVKQDKGGVHLHFNSAITPKQLNDIAALNKNDRFKALGRILDESIVSSYKLWNTNYIAYDIITQGDNYKDHYTMEEKEAFIEYCNKGVGKMIQYDNELDNIDELKEIFYTIYANPIKNMMELV